MKLQMSHFFACCSLLLHNGKKSLLCVVAAIKVISIKESNDVIFYHYAMRSGRNVFMCKCDKAVEIKM